MDYVGFKVASESDLDALGERIGRRGTKIEEIPPARAAGTRTTTSWSFTVPTGHRIELFARMALAKNGINERATRSYGTGAARDVA